MKKEMLTLEQKWESLTLANNFIFYKVMRHHPKECQHLIEMLLGIKIEHMEMSNEETIEIDHDSHGIRLEDGKTKLNDRAYKHFFIAKNCAKMIENKEVRAFFDFLTTNKSADSFTSDLHSYVTNAKHNMQWRFQYMTWERQRTYDREEGMEIGARENAIANAKNALAMGLSPEQASQITSLPLEQVLALKEELAREQVAISN